MIFTGVALKPEANAAGGALTATVRLPREVVTALARFLVD
jgi:hypothetical protein